MDRTATSVSIPNPIVEQEVVRIQGMNLAELRAMWRAQMKNEPPKAFGPDLLRRSLAYRIQEKAYGGLDAKTARLLKQLVAQSAKNAGKISLPRRTKAVGEKPAVCGHSAPRRRLLRGDHTGWLTWLDSNSRTPKAEIAFEFSSEFRVIARKYRPETDRGLAADCGICIHRVILVTGRADPSRCPFCPL